MDIGWGGASASLGDGKSNTRGSSSSSSSETNIESRISILAI